MNCVISVNTYCRIFIVGETSIGKHNVGRKPVKVMRAKITKAISSKYLLSQYDLLCLTSELPIIIHSIISSCS